MPGCPGSSRRHTVNGTEACPGRSLDQPVVVAQTSGPMASWAMEPKACTVFIVLGDDRFLPDELTSAIGITPTESHRLGELTRSSRPWKHACWRLAIGPEALLDHSAQVERLLDVVEPTAPLLHEFRERLSLEVSFKLWWSGIDESQSNPYLCFSAALLQRVTALLCWHRDRRLIMRRRREP